MEVPVVENVLKLNDEIARELRERLDAAGVYALDLIGAPGCGKTAMLEATLRLLRDELTLGVLVGDLATTRDAQRLMKHCPHVVQINTGRGCHLDANQVKQALARLDLDRLDLLVIENVGNLICPVGFDLGQHSKVGMFSVAEGDDKPAKHPHLVHAADLILLNKTDLLPHVPFDRPRFMQDVRALNGRAPVIQMHALADDDPGLAAWCDHLRACVGVPT